MKIDWEIFFNTLNGNKNLPISAIEQTADTVSIVLPEDIGKAFATRLATSLSSQAAFIDSFPFEITPAHAVSCPASSSSSSSNNVVNSIAPKQPETLQQCYDVLASLFGKRTMAVTGMSCYLSLEDGAKAKDGVLYSSAITDPDLLKAIEAHLKHLIAHFADVDDEKLQQVWKDPRSYLAAPSKTLNSKKDADSKLAGLVSHCFIIDKYPDENDPDKTIARIRINVKGLYEYLFPPLIITSEVATDTNEKNIMLTFNRNHLLSRVQHLMGGPLLRVCHNAEEQQSYLSPIFAGLEGEEGRKPTLYVLEIDCSGSIEPSIKTLRAQIISVIRQLRLDDSHPGSKLRLVTFSATTNAEEYPLHELDIESWAKNLKSYYETRLFGTVHDEISRLLKTDISKDYNIVHYLITDGYDNHSKNITKRSIDRLIEECTRKGITLPAIITAGINGSAGNGDMQCYDIGLLESLAKSLKGVFYDMQHGGDFTALASETARKLSCPRDEVSFVHQIADSLSVYRIPIYADGSLQMPAISIPIGNESHVIGIDGKEWIVSVQDPSSLPEETTNEIARRTLATAQTIMSDEKEDTKCAKLNQAKHALEALAQKVESDTVVMALKTILEYCERAKEPVESATRRSTISQAAHKRGWVSIETHRGREYFPAATAAASSSSSAALLASAGGPLHPRSPVTADDATQTQGYSPESMCSIT